VVPLGDLTVAIRGTLAEWARLRWSDLQLAEVQTALLVFVVFVAVAGLTLIGRGLASRIAGRPHVALPALLPVMRRSYWAATRHSAFLVFLLGMPFFAVALADPRTSFTREEVSYPGRRIAILIDASSSMILKFEGDRLRPTGGPAFYTAVAAAERFMRIRMDGPYRDLIALVEFGNEAYVVTPFTTDYENVLLSIKLIADPKNWGRFNDWGTTIIQGIEQGTQLFKTFDFLNASGNLMLIFSDGQDGQTMLKGRPLDDLVAEARRYQIPIYMVRTAYRMKLGDIPGDKIWKAAIEQTGGRFYPAAEEEDILNAVRDIDRVSAGRIDTREYTAFRPRFSGYALIAVGLWLLAALLKLAVPYFRTFP
jgi:hypothetical protein